MPDPDTPHHGSRPVDLRVDADRAEELKRRSADWPSWTCTDLQLADLELLATGAYAPLRGFATHDEHAAVLEGMRLPDGTLWPLPIVLDLDEATAESVEEGAPLALRDAEGTMLAVLDVTSVWRGDPRAEARRLLGDDDPRHPEVAALLRRSGPVRVGGPLEVLELPAHLDLAAARATPDQVRAELARRGWARTLALHLRGVPTIPLLARARATAEELDAGVLWHAAAGPTEPGDLDRFARLRVAERLEARLGPRRLVRATPLPTRLAGPRETVLRAIVRQNHGASHLLVGPDDAATHRAGPGGALFAAHAGARLLEEVADELAIEPVAIPRQVHLPGAGPVSADERPEDDLAAGEAHVATEAVDVDEARLRETLARDLDVPEELIAPEIRHELSRAWPPRHRRGLVVFLTGLSGSGKSTVAKVLRARLLEAGGRTVTLLDGDLVRRNLSSELGFSKEHRDLNVLRIGYVASEIAKHGGIAVCAPIAPYDEIRKANRAAIEGVGGGYVLVHVATPLEVCEARDRKGLYAKARAGQLTGFTGIDDPYEVPDDAAVTLDTTDIEPAQAVERILDHLREEGWWPPRP